MYNMVYITHEVRHLKLIYRYFLFYALVIGGNGIINIFMPVYLKSLDFGNLQVGAILACGPLTALFAQPFWGIAADRSKYKNSVLKLIFLFCAIFSIIYSLHGNFYYVIVFYTIMMFFYSSIFSLSDSITLEGIAGTGYKFGIIRLGGTLGFIVVILAAGQISNSGVSLMFPLYSIIAILSMALVFVLPKIRGHQSAAEGKKKVPFLKLLKKKELVLILAYNLIIQITLGFYYSFFPIFFMQIGASTGVIAISYAISASSEIPFLLFAERILKKIGIMNMLLISGTATGLRWLLLSQTSRIGQVMAIQVLHGIIFVAMTLSIAIYINENVQNELKASGQSLNTVSGIWLAKIAGSIFGGVASQFISLRQIFFVLSFVCFAAVIIFYLLKNKFRESYGAVDIPSQIRS
jgi:MFS transporter, PPP family, 3-phenylpropionic acid transporter